MNSQTESIVNPDAGYMEFNLTTEMGYQEWRGMFAELGVKATLFNGYMLQTPQNGVQISTTPVQLHLYEHSVYLAPPFEAQSYYFEIARPLMKQAKVYFRIPSERSHGVLDGYKPERDELYALDVWVDEGEGVQSIYSLIYEARIQTEHRVYEISRFESEQLFDKN